METSTRANPIGQLKTVTMEIKGKANLNYKLYGVVGIIIAPLY